MKNEYSKVHLYFKIITILFFCTNFAYSQSNYSLNFKSGKVDLIENIDSYNQQTRTIFNGYNYAIIQFNHLPSQEQKEHLNSIGIKLIDYIPNLAYSAKIPTSIDKTSLKESGIRAFYKMDAQQKMEENLFLNSIPTWAKQTNDLVEVKVILMDEFPEEILFSSLDLLQATVVSEEKGFRSLSLLLPQNNLKELASQEWVMWVEAKPEPVHTENFPGKNTHRSSILQDGNKNLTGKGVAIGVWDGGNVGKHIDFSGHFTQVENAAVVEHTCHVSGTLVGGGLIDPLTRGMAPESKLYAYNFNGTVETEVQNAINSYGIVITSNSYGGSATCSGDPYSSTARSRDLIVNTNPQLIHVFSAGNSQTSCPNGYYTTTGKAAKNPIVVGAVTSGEVVTTFTSFGPTLDKRIKPDITTVGMDVYSTKSKDLYQSMSGTSMACPGMAGTAAQIVQRYRQLNANANPIASLVKALVCNNAKDLGNAGPDYKYGYGRLNALRAVKAIEQNLYAINTVANGSVKTITINVPSGISQLKVLLCWNDPAAAANASIALVNDLDLEVMTPSNTTYYPWVLDGMDPSAVATRMVDDLNVMEQVTISTPVAGSYTLKVKGTAVTTNPTQQYALTWVMDPAYIEVTYPSGNEMLNPGTTEMILWDKEGITSTQKIEFSSDSGATWSTISASVGASASTYNWLVPTTVTKKALIKISSGTISDVSDSKFSIIGVPANLTATSAPCGVRISWSAVISATGYDVMLLDTVLGVWNVVGSNVTATNYTVGGLLTGLRYWFTVRSRVSSLGITGQRAVAINKVNQNAGITPTINIVGSVLSTQSATTYQWLLNGVSIPGAISQNYTATQNGSYSVIVTNSSGCVATSLPINIVVTGLAEQENTVQYAIYPNPNSGVFEVALSGIDDKSQLMLMNALGEQVTILQFDSSTVNKTIDLSKYGSGLYIATLIINGQLIKTKKIIVY